MTVNAKQTSGHDVIDLRVLCRSEIVLVLRLIEDLPVCGFVMMSGEMTDPVLIAESAFQIPARSALVVIRNLAQTGIAQQRALLVVPHGRIRIRKNFDRAG